MGAAEIHTIGVKNMKKFLAAILALVMALGVTTMAWAADEYVAEVGGTKYTTLESAINAAKSGETIKLLANVTENTNKDEKKTYNLKNKTLNLNNYTYTQNNFAYIFEGDGGKIMNGKMVCADGGSYALPIGWKDRPVNGFVVEDVETTGGINVTNSKNVVLRNVTVTGTKYYAVWANPGADVTIESGSYTAGGGGVVGAGDDEAYEVGKMPKLTLTGGTFNTNGKSLVCTGAAIGEVEIKGGNFADVTEGKIVNNDKVKLTVSGGEFNLDMSAEANVKYLADGAPVATVAGTSNTTYAVGSSAIAAAANGGKDVTVVKAGAISGVNPSAVIKADVAGVSVNGTLLTEGQSYTVPARYYYTSTTTDTKKDDNKSTSPKTFDAGVGIYAVSALLSVTGMACVGKKKF